MSQRKYIRSVTSFPRINLDEVMVSRGVMVSVQEDLEVIA